MKTVETRDEGAGEGFLMREGGVYPGWITAFASMMGLALGPSALMVFCFGTFAIPISQEFGWSIATVSAGATIISVMIMITSIVQGRLVDRFGGRRLALISIPLMGMGFASMQFLPNEIGVFRAAWVVIPLLALGAWPISYLKMTAAWFERRLGLAFGVANAGVGIGAAMLPPFAAYAIAHYGWRNAYAMLGVLAVLVTWPIVFFMLRDREQAGGVHGLQRPLPSGLNFKAASATKAFRLGLIAFTLLGVASATMIVHQTRILIDLGMTPQRAAGLQAVLGISLIFGRICTGWMLDRLAVTSVMPVLCLAAAGALATLASGGQPGAAPLCAAVMGFVIGAEFDVLSYLIPRYFGRKAFGAIYGVMFAAFQLASAVAITVVGISRSSSGSYGTALWWVAALMIPCALCFALMGSYLYASSGSSIGADAVPAR